MRLIFAVKQPLTPSACAPSDLTLRNDICQLISRMISKGEEMSLSSKRRTNRGPIIFNALPVTILLCLFPIEFSLVKRHNQCDKAIN